MAKLALRLAGILPQLRAFDTGRSAWRNCINGSFRRSMDRRPTDSARQPGDGAAYFKPDEELLAAGTRSPRRRQRSMALKSLTENGPGVLTLQCTVHGWRG